MGDENMFNKKMLFMPHLPTSGAGVVDSAGRAGYSKSLNMWTIYIKFNFRLHCIGKSFNGWLLKLGCHFFSTWHCIKCNSICTTGQVLKINNIYTYKEDNDIDIVRLLDVYQAKGYMYCTLYFFTRNKISTVSQMFNTNKYTIWRIMDNEEYDERMSTLLWQGVNKDDDLLDFAY